MHDLTEKKPLNIGGLLILFILFTVAGVILSYAYLGLIEFSSSIYPNIIIAGGYGVLLYFLVHGSKKMLKITNDNGAIIVVILGIVIINYFKWQIHFGVWYARFAGYDLSYIDIGYVLEMLEYMIAYPFESGLNPISVFFSDLRFFNSVGTWTFGGGATPVTGVWLAIVWIAEFIIMFGIPLIAAMIAVGVLLPSYNKFASPKHLLYNFTHFADSQLETLAAYKDLNVILNQPLAGANSVIKAGKYNVETIVKNFNGDVSVVAHLHIGNEPTEYILISQINSNSWTQGDMVGKWSAPIPLGMEEIERLKEELAKLHGESEAVQDETAAEMSKTAETLDAAPAADDEGEDHRMQE